MAGNYLKKAKFLNFFKRLTTSELKQNTSLSKGNFEHNKSIQKVSSFWREIGWNYYRRQLQETVGRFVAGFETGFQELGRKVPASSRRSLRQAKRNVLQLMNDSRKRIQLLEQEITRLYDRLPYKETTSVKFHSRQRFGNESVSMMEEGTIGEITGEIKCNSIRETNNHLSLYNRYTTLIHEPRYKERQNSCINDTQTQADLPSALNSAAIGTLRLASDSPKIDSALSLRTPEADAPRALILFVKENNGMSNTLQEQPLVNKSSD